MSKEYSFKGTVKDVLGIEEVGQNGLKKNSVVFTVKDGEYENDVVVDFMKERAEKVDALVPGESVEVYFNFRSNQSSGGRWFTNISGWKWNVLEPNGNVDPSY